MANEVQRMATPVAEFRGELDRMAQEFEKVLPAHITPEKFQRVVVTAVQLNPELLTADRRSFIAAIMKCAQDGLLPDKREAAFVIFKTNENGKWVQQVQYMPMIYGLFKKMRQSGEIAGITVHVVYTNDEFRIELGDNEQFHHMPAFKDPGEPIGAYAIATFKDGYREREFMTHAQIEKVRSASKNATGKNAPWSVWWDEMAKKTVVRRLSKRLPMSSDIELVLDRDNDLYEFPALDTPTADQLKARPTMGQIEGPENTDIDNAAGDEEDALPADEGYPYLTPDGEIIEFADPEYFAQNFCTDVASLKRNPAGLAGLLESNEETLKTLPPELMTRCREAAEEAEATPPVDEEPVQEPGPEPQETEQSEPQETAPAGLPAGAFKMLCNAFRSAKRMQDIEHRLAINKDTIGQMSEAQRHEFDTVVATMKHQLKGATR